MMPHSLLLALVAALTIAIALYYRKKYLMSQASVTRLLDASKAATERLAAQDATIKTLTDQLAAATASPGVPDVVIDAVSLELEQAVNPPVPAPVPDPAPTT